MRKHPPAKDEPRARRRCAGLRAGCCAVRLDVEQPLPEER